MRMRCAATKKWRKKHTGKDRLLIYIYIYIICARNEVIAAREEVGAGDVSLFYKTIRKNR